MKNRVNLYHPELHPKLRLLTLSSVIVSWIFAAIFCGLLYLYMTLEQQDFKSQISKIEQNKQQQKLLVNELQNALDKQKVDPILLKQVQKILQNIDIEKRVLNKLSGHDKLKSNSFSTLMIDLASHNQSGLWLTHINLDGMSVLIEGAATDSAIVPKWLSSLGQTDYFRGQEFADTRLYRDSEQQLNFVISTGKEASIEEGSNNE
jgi:Tfp pilus assembly protein PilN